MNHHVITTMTLCSEVLSIIDRLHCVELESADLESVSRRVLRIGSARYRITLITADVCSCFVEKWHGHRVHAPLSFRTAREFADFLLDVSSVEFPEGSPEVFHDRSREVSPEDRENDHFEALREASAD
jgi:hypothetical protein